MAEEEEVMEIGTFLGQVIKPGTVEKLKTSEFGHTILTGVSLGEIKGKEKSVLIAHVSLDAIIPDEANQEQKKDVVIATLIPDVCETAALGLRFSPFDEVTLEVKGPNEVHVSGGYEDIWDDFDYDLEEEEEEEEAKEEEKQTKKK